MLELSLVFCKHVGWEKVLTAPNPDDEELEEGAEHAPVEEILNETRIECPRLKAVALSGTALGDKDVNRLFKECRVLHTVLLAGMSKLKYPIIHPESLRALVLDDSGMEATVQTPSIAAALKGATRYLPTKVGSLPLPPFSGSLSSYPLPVPYARSPLP